MVAKKKLKSISTVVKVKFQGDKDQFPRWQKSISKELKSTVPGSHNGIRAEGKGRSVQ